MITYPCFWATLIHHRGIFLASQPGEWITTTTATRPNKVDLAKLWAHMLTLLLPVAKFLILYYLWLKSSWGLYH